MKEKFVNSLTNFVIKNKDVDDIKLKTIRYGLEGLYLSTTKFIVILGLAILTHTIKEYFLLLLFYLTIRKYSFGLHANSSLGCWLTTVPIYIGGSLIIKYFDIPFEFKLVIWGISFISFVFWAPADTPKRPLIRAKQRKIQKFKTCIISVIYLIILLFIKNSMITDTITISLIIQSIMINPLTYKITNTNFNSYKLYPNKV